MHIIFIPFKYVHNVHIANSVHIVQSIKFFNNVQIFNNVNNVIIAHYGHNVHNVYNVHDVQLRGLLFIGIPFEPNGSMFVRIGRNCYNFFFHK